MLCCEFVNVVNLIALSLRSVYQARLELAAENALEQLDESLVNAEDAQAAPAVEVNDDEIDVDGVEVPAAAAD